MCIRVFENLLTEYIMKKSELKLLPYYMSSNLPFLGPISGGNEYFCLLVTKFMLGESRSQTLGFFGGLDIDMDGINRESNSISYMTYY